MNFEKITFYQSFSSVPVACSDCRPFHTVTSPADAGIPFFFFLLLQVQKKIMNPPLLQFNSCITGRPWIFVRVIYFIFEVNTDLSEIFARSICKLNYVGIMPRYKHKSEC